MAGGSACPTGANVGQALPRYLQNSPQLLCVVKKSKAPVAYARGSERMSYRAATVRSCEKIGSQAKAPAPLNRKSWCVNVGQTLPSANPARLPIFSQLLRLREPVLFGSSYFASTSLPPANRICHNASSSHGCGSEGPLSIRPGRRSVRFPAEITGSPFMINSVTPSAYWWRLV